ncbi:hypothetical protein E4T38_03149 [Aureobasidium subglaciale]|nr:hypothetical protein E4T38_03149 [Aureobasidium subglaciale]KAI5226991.1 hypothetical protein E4T40_02923 [Aureobasidium subglaciale]KAI5230124.1 hypothetical protein E4T41_03146 [Aureobasidium subglaciale]KAI5264714.1 hypothetical protein E4T46_02924 [Aureobasidium subglaciale]
MQFESKKDIATAKHELQRDVFEPANDVMEAFLLFARFFEHDDGPTARLDETAFPWSQAVLLRLVIEYIVVIDAFVKDSNLASKMKAKCLAVYQKHFPWMLDPRYILQEHKSAAVDDATIKLDEDLKADLSSQSRDLVDHLQDEGDSDQYSLSEDSYDEPSDAEATDSGPKSRVSTSRATRYPSITLDYHQYTFWPNVAHLSRQSRRPYSVLASPKRSHNLRISGWDFAKWISRTWYGDGRVEDSTRDFTSFQPRVVVAKKRGFTSGLPTKICVAGFRWINPDGGPPKSLGPHDEDNDVSALAMEMKGLLIDSGTGSTEPKEQN